MASRFGFSHFGNFSAEYKRQFAELPSITLAKALGTSRAGAAHRGCVGAVVDGGIRDTAYIRRARFPIFHKFTCPGDAVGRFNIVDYNCPVTVGGVRVSPGDYIFGDEDGIVVIPAGLTMEVLEKSEALCAKESLIREEISTGKSVADLYKEYGKF